MKFSCPECGKNLKVKDEHSGKTITCPACGSKITVPAPDGGSGASCPGCGAGVAPDAVICVKCGTNLRSGEKLATATGGGPEPRPVSAEAIVAARRPVVFGLIGPAIKLAVLAGLAVAGWQIYMYLSEVPYGIAEGAPLGTAKVLDEKFAELDFDKVTGPVAAPAAFGKGAVVSEYVDTRFMHKMGGIREAVAVVSGASGKVVCLGGHHHRVPEGTLPAAWSNANRFLRHYWGQVGCGEPKWEGRTVGGGMFSEEPEIANFKNSEIQARWVKLPPGVMPFETYFFVKLGLPLDGLGKLKKWGKSRQPKPAGGAPAGGAGG